MPARRWRMLALSTATMLALLLRSLREFHEPLPAGRVTPELAALLL